MEKLKLLLVDADEESCFWVRKHLEGEYEIAQVDTGEAAIESLHSKDFDLILLDEHLEEGQGVELCERLRTEAKFRHVPIVICSSSPRPEIIVQAYEKGANDFLQKLTNPNELKARIAITLKNREELENLQEAYDRLKDQSERDPLTQLYNRRALVAKAESEVEKVKRSDVPIVFLMIDLDKFKLVNDQYGHVAGDELLIGFSDLLRSKLRRYDIVGRYGGDEFVVILPQTNAEMGRLVAEKVWKCTEETVFESSAGPIRITVSIGVVPVTKNVLKTDQEFNFSTFLQRVDEALYSAKEKGRNQVRYASFEE